MDIVFESVLERDMDFLIMRRFTALDMPVINLFLNQVGIQWDSNYHIENISHSVMTADGESDIEIIISDGKEEIAFLIEDKIDAIAQPEQYNRYIVRADKAVENRKYAKYYIFIMAPMKYLEGNKEAGLYPYHVSYEQIRESLSDVFEIALMDKALDETKHGYVPIEDRRVTEFWNRIYDFAEEKYPGIFRIQGKKGSVRGSNAVWISISCGTGTIIQIKADRGYVDLEISGYAEKFQKFSKDNQALLDEKRLYVRMASKSLAIRKYCDPFFFTGDFDAQIENIYDAFEKAKELQDLIKDLKF